MRVTVVAPGIFDKGGISRYVRYQVRALREAFGDDAVRVVSLLGRMGDDLEEHIDVQWAGPSVLSRPARALFASVVLNDVRHFPPDILVSGHVNLGPLVACAARVSRAMVVQNIYGIEVWSGLAPHRRLALASADAVISDCWNTESEARRLGLIRSPLHVVWDCVELGRYCPGPPNEQVLRRYGIERDRPFRLLFLARLNRDTRYKGSERVLEVLATLAPEVELVFAGTGNDMDHLRDLSRALHVDDRVRFTGSIREPDMPDVYRSASAFYLVSSFGKCAGEGLPLTPIEAMACGVPVVVGDADGSREVLDGAGGLCTAPDDLAGQAAYVLSLARSPRLLNEERIAARERAEKAFGFEAFRTKTVEAINATASRPRRSLLRATRRN